MKKYIALFLSIILMFALSACTSGDKKDLASTGSNKKTKITFVLDYLPNTNHTGIYVAEKNGYFDDAGLEVEIQQPPEDGAEALVASGNAQFGISFQENIGSILVSDTPMPITAVATVIQHNTSGIISLKETGIKTPKDMTGNNYATWDLPIEKAILKDVINKDGGNYDEVEKIPSMVTDTFAALQSGIDTVWIYYAWDGVAAEVKGIETNYFAFKDINPDLDFYTPVIIANDNFLKENPEAAKAFLNAARMGYEYAIENPESAADILCEAVPEIDKGIAIASQKYLAGQYKAEVERWGEIDKSRWDNFYTWLYDNKVIDKQIPSSKGFTNDYLN